MLVRKRTFSVMLHEFVHSLDAAINTTRHSLRWDDNPLVPYHIGEQANRARLEYIARADKYPDDHPEAGYMMRVTYLDWYRHTGNFFNRYQTRLYDDIHEGEISPEYITVNAQKYMGAKFRMYQDYTFPDDTSMNNVKGHTNTPYGLVRNELNTNAPELLKLLDLLFEDSDRLAKRLGREPSTNDAMSVIEDDLLGEFGKGLFELQEFNPTS